MKINHNFILHTAIPILLFLVVLVIRFQQVVNVPFQEGQRVVVKSCITEEPVIRNNKQEFQIEGIYVKTSDIVRYSFGDCLELTGALRKKVITFFYPQILLIDPAIVKTGTLTDNQNQLHSFHTFYHLIKYRSDRMRVRFQEIYYRFFPAPQHQLLSGIVLGSKEIFTAPFYRALIQSGMVHIVAASGMNLTIFVGTFLEILASLCGRKKAIVLNSFLCWFYAFLSGLAPSIVRAGIMLSFIWFGQLDGRGSNSIRILLITVGVMLIFHPLLLFNVGFWLSITATGGLVVVSPLIKDWIERKEKLDKVISCPILEWIEVKSSLVSSIGAYLATLPIIVLVFRLANPLSFIPNIFTLWLIPYIMAIGAVLGVIGLFYLPAAIWLSQILWPPLTFMVGMIRIFGEKINWLIRAPEFGSYAILLALLYYFVLIKLSKRQLAN